jgi:hypothetical protein
MVGGSRNAVAVFSRESGYDIVGLICIVRIFLFWATATNSPGALWAKQESKQRVSRASLTMQDHDFIVKNGARK